MKKRLEERDLRISPDLAMAYLVGNLCYNNSKHEEAKRREIRLDIVYGRDRLYHLKLK